MKLIGIMSLEDDKNKVKEIFEKHGVEIFSEVDIKGHTLSTIEKYGWWPSNDLSVYSSMCFAIIAKYRADEIMEEMSKMSGDDTVHAIRAFQVDVERMI